MYFHASWRQEYPIKKDPYDWNYITIEGQGVMGGPSSGIVKLVGGTGACTGITGTIELKGVPGVKPAKEGTYQGISVGKMNWKIP